VETSGSILVFLPGAREIHRLAAFLQSASLPAGVQVQTLYGDLSAAAQDDALAPPDAGGRKIVLATNIAETSLTIPGVTAVVDAGLARRSLFDPTTGMSRLELGRISRAASDQRAGRAGRVAAGIGYRLWSETAHGRLQAATPAEILEADLAPLALELACWGIEDASRLRWLDPPSAAHLSQARDLLRNLEALDERGAPTACGRALARLPVHPRLGRMLLAARDLQGVSVAANLAALLSERDLMRRSEPDVRNRLDMLRGSAPAGVDRSVLHRVQQTARRLQESVAHLPASGSGSTTAPGPMPVRAKLPEADLPGAVLAFAYPDRIGQRRTDGEGRYLLSGGRGAAFRGATSLAREEFVVAVELNDQDKEARIDLAAPIARATLETLFVTRITTIEEFGWDVREQAVIARSVRRLGALVLDARKLPVATDDRSIAAMLEGLQALGLSALPWDPETRQLQARMEFVRRLGRTDLTDWPRSDDEALLMQSADWLSPWLQGVTRRAHLTGVPLATALRDRLPPAQRRALEELAPRELTVPSGSRIRIDYLDDSAPAVAVRLQEVFGLQQTPRVGAGSTPVTFKLLSPAQRPVQITRDLAGFWRSSYAEVRKEMRGRYPRHDWPENPLEAVPSRRSTRRPR
jgi:ATP-dependent helicase HrpB